MDKLNNFSKYFIDDNTDSFMGLTVNDIGHTLVKPNQEYPSHKEDHRGYYFKWETGRKLKDYQIVYISNGAGTFESENDIKFEVTPGTVFFFFSEVWHRYQPLPNTGWTEYWIGRSLKDDNSLFINNIINPQNPFFTIGLNTRIIKAFNEVFEIGQEFSSGAMASMSGATYFLMGMIIDAIKNKNFSGTSSEKMVQKAICILYDSVEKNTNIEQVAEMLNISYSLFRKKFTEYTGIPPKQYLLKLKLSKAEDLLRFSTLSIKEISDLLGFENQNYFSKYIKQKTGIAPNEHRNSNSNN
jgi:AraC-like DNA-binding protein